MLIHTLWFWRKGEDGPEMLEAWEEYAAEANPPRVLHQRDRGEGRMSRQFDWLLAGAWAGIILALIVFWVGVFAIVEWLA
jgi:hypothetical protein